MEATGTCDIFPCIVIKEACGYADSHKNKEWYPKTIQQTPPPSGRELQTKLQVGSTLRTDNMIDVHAIIEHLRQQKEDLLIRISDLKIQLRKEKELPPQVQVTDLVTVNDALGAIYSFFLSFVDSWEVILKQKFQGSGEEKIERGEWMLQNHSTGHVLNLKKSWKAVVKPGQILNMSMVFKKAYNASTSCPWCNLQNELNIENRHVQCQTCSGFYSRVEEVHDVIGVKDSDPQNVDDRQRGRERETAGPLPLRQINGEDEDIHLYTRVHILGVSFRNNQPGSLDNRLQKRQRQIVARDKDLEEVSHLVHRLAKDLQLPEKDCRVVISEFLAQSIPPAKADGMDWGKTSIMPEGPFGQISTHVVSEEAASGNERSQTHQMLSPFEPHLDLSSSDKDSKADKMGRFNAQSSAQPEYTRIRHPSESANLVLYRDLFVEYWADLSTGNVMTHHCLDNWNSQHTNQCFNCGHLRCYQFNMEKMKWTSSRLIDTSRPGYHNKDFI